jgi:hypothetical protein
VYHLIENEFRGVWKISFQLQMFFVNLVGHILPKVVFAGGVAQWSSRPPEKHKIVGSNPAGV